MIDSWSSEDAVPIGVPGLRQVRPFSGESEPAAGVIAFLADLAMPTGETSVSPSAAEVWALARADCLAPAERARAERFVRGETGRCWSVAHVILRHILGTLVGREPGDLRFGRGRHGKPFLEEVGDVEFSLSHAGSLVLVAVIPRNAGGWRIGADVESTMRVPVAREVARCLHPDEGASVDRMPDAEAVVAVTRAWARKEAFLKALGTGLLRDPSLDVVGVGTDPRPADGAGTRLIDLLLPSGGRAHAAICLQRGVRLI